MIETFCDSYHMLGDGDDGWVLYCTDAKEVIARYDNLDDYYKEYSPSWHDLKKHGEGVL